MRIQLKTKKKKKIQMEIDNDRSMENKCNSQANQISDMKREKVALKL